MESQSMYHYIKNEFESDYNLEALLEDKSETFKIIKHIKEKNNLCFKASSDFIKQLDNDTIKNDDVVDLVKTISDYYSINKTAITNYVLEMFSNDPSKALPIIKYLHNSYYISKTILSKEMTKLDNGSRMEIVINQFKELENYLNSYTLFFSVFLDSEKIDSALKNYKIDITNDIMHKIDGRNKKGSPTNQHIAYSISYVFASVIGELTKKEKVRLFDNITCKSGDNIYQFYGNTNRLTSEEVKQIEDELSDIKIKIKKK